VISTSRRGKGRRANNGQSLVEFALVLPIFLLVLFGLIDAARLVYMNSVLSQAAREGARVASVETGWIGSSDVSCGTLGGPVCPATTAVLQTHITAAANRMVAPFATIASGSVYVICGAKGSTPPTGAWTAAANPATCASRSANDLVSVRTLMTFQPITPIAGPILGSISLSGDATMVIN